MRRFIIGLTVCACACAPEIELDAGELADTLGTMDGPTLEFDPGNGILPSPNNLVINPANGIVTIPEQACETPTTTMLRTMVLNTLDGFGTYQAASTATFTEEFDISSFTDEAMFDRVVYIKVADKGVPLTMPTAVPFVVVESLKARLNPADCTAAPTMVPQAAIVPTIPLDPNSTYAIGIREGVTTTDAVEFIPSYVWALVRQSENPVTVEDGVLIAHSTPLDATLAEDYETLLGVDLLWNAHNAIMTALAAVSGQPRESFLVGWSFNTHTTTAPIAALAAALPTDGIDGPVGSGAPYPVSILGAETPSEFLEHPDRLGAGTCTVLPCAAIGDIMAGNITLTQYQLAMPNPLTGGDPVPGPWNHPRTPTTAGAIGDEDISVLIVTPNITMPEDGFPVVVYAHGITRSQNDVMAIASQLAMGGFATVAIDWVAHGSRAVQVTDAAALGCDGTPSPSTAPQCFAPIFSTNLAATRDNFRQSVLDVLGLKEAVKACTAASPCGDLAFDSDKMGYMGMSLGGIFGGMVVGSTGDFGAAVFNVGGAGWVDIIENTDTPSLRCPLVDGLIDSGVLFGDKWNGANSGLCMTDTWAQQPGWATFAGTGRWILDPADPANYYKGLAAKSILVQEVANDTVVPNIATTRLAALLGVTAPVAANEYTGATAQPVPTSVALGAAPALILYSNIAAIPGDPDAEPPTPPTPGNAFNHGSLLAPAAGAGSAGSAGTVQMQGDAIAYLVMNLLM